jgi:Serpentine type 7TM GPCR chemoreceptor Srh
VKHNALTFLLRYGIDAFSSKILADLYGMNPTLAQAIYLPTFYHPLLHTISVSNTLVTTVSVWVIVRHSPPSMAVYKWFLLNVALASFIYDTFVTVIADPGQLNPLVAVCANSFISSQISADEVAYGFVSLSRALLFKQLTH